MGPRPLGRGRLTARLGHCDARGGRQWGRDLSAAEGGKLCPCCSVCLATVNGAATSRPRKAGSWGLTCKSCHTVNGAATSRPRKEHALWVEARRHERPSMGPRPLGRGRRSAEIWRGAALDRQWGRDLSAAEGPILFGAALPRPPVNGAATSRPRKARFARRSAPCRPPVNGAATSRPRKALIFDWDPPQIDHRQWGRDLSAAEGLRLKSLCDGPLPSMGPRPLGRGRPSVRSPTRSCGSNRQWGRDLSAAEGANYVRHVMENCDRQWGRDLSAAEGRVQLFDGGRGPVPVNGAATSRPRKARNIARTVGPSRRRQWGRDLSAAEGTAPRQTGRRQTSVNGAATSRPRKDLAEARADVARLRQWGRDLSAAEGYFADHLPSLRASVNGAATSRPRKVPTNAARPAWILTVNGAATSRPRKAADHARRAHSKEPSMGPRPLGRGRKTIACCERRWEAPSMGPRPLGRGRAHVRARPSL